MNFLGENLDVINEETLLVVAVFSGCRHEEAVEVWINAFRAELGPESRSTSEI